MAIVKMVVSSFQVSTHFHPCVSHDLNLCPPPPRKDFWLRHCRLLRPGPLHRRQSIWRISRGAVSKVASVISRGRRLPPLLHLFSAPTNRRCGPAGEEGGVRAAQLFFVTEASADNRRANAAGRRESGADSDVLRLAAGVRGRTLRAYACVHTSVALHVIFQTCVCTCRYLTHACEPPCTCS